MWPSKPGAGGRGLALPLFFQEPLSRVAVWCRGFLLSTSAGLFPETTTERAENHRAKDNVELL